MISKGVILVTLTFYLVTPSGQNWVEMGLIYVKFTMDNIGPQRTNPNFITMTFTEHIHAPQRRHLFQ